MEINVCNKCINVNNKECHNTKYCNETNKNMFKL